MIFTAADARTRLMRHTLLAVFALGSVHIAQAVEFHVDCLQRIGTVRPLQGVNNGPLNCGETIDLSRYYRDLRIPFVRLHDSEWPNPNVVDIHTIFHDMSSDPASPASYSFQRTDDYIQAIINTGSGIVYRLGESIEHSPRKYNVNPPSDPQKWADVCIGIIRHYNTGWADGFHHGIRYWEIWNEPENRPVMWTGDDEQYYSLYATTAKKIKAEFPDLKVGGPSIGAPGELLGDSMKPSPFLKGFLQYCKDHHAPMDFFSWHTYTNDPYIYARKARAIRRLLDEYGFADAEIHLNEWNYLPDNDWAPMLTGDGIVKQRWYEKMGGESGAAFLATALIDLQDSPVDVANYYCGDTSPFGLFNRFAAPKKTFYATKAFSMLADMPVRVRVSTDSESPTTACAAITTDQTQLTVLVASFSSNPDELRLRIDGFGDNGFAWQLLRIDKTHDLQSTRSGSGNANSLLTEPLEGPCVLLWKFSNASAVSPNPTGASE